MDKTKIFEIFSAWYDNLKKIGGFPPKGTLAGALGVLDALKVDFNLDIEAHTAPGGSQIKGASGSRVKAILAEHGETRPFVSEGGRTNRGLRGVIKEMLDAITKMPLDTANEEERNEIIDELQVFLVEKVKDWHQRQRLQIEYNPGKSTRAMVKELLASARGKNVGGQVAQYLVGAKLAQRLRHTDIIVTNESYSTADVQLGRQGDFLVRDTVFHVTLVPIEAVINKCVHNLQDGFRVFLLVPDEEIPFARTLADRLAAGKIAVESIESFVGQNIDEMAEFSTEKLRQEFYELLTTYNKRVNDAEIDKSLMIEIPVSLAR